MRQLKPIPDWATCCHYLLLDGDGEIVCCPRSLADAYEIAPIMARETRTQVKLASMISGTVLARFSRVTGMHFHYCAQLDAAKYRRIYPLPKDYYRYFDIDYWHFLYCANAGGQK